MKITKIPEDAVLIKGSKTDYVDPRGNIYSINTKWGHPQYPFIKEQNTVWGYQYCAIKYDDGNGKNKKITKRVHRLVAEAFLPNPNNYPFVMHIDNNKKNNDISNLKWGTASENTQQAVNDGLLINDKSWDDSQSIPCDCYETTTNKLIKKYGSRKEAAADTGISASTIARQSELGLPIRKKIYFTNADEGPREHVIVVQFDYDTDAEIARFPNCGSASRETGVCEKTINQQVNCNQKPKHKFGEAYFLKMLLKCEETIESKKRVE